MLLPLLLASIAPAPVWTIGTRDNSSDEFGNASEPAVVYDVDAHPSPKAWRQKQSDGDRFTIRFSLPVSRAPGYHLELDGFFVDPGADALRLEINGHRGSYRLRGVPGPDLDFRDGSSPTFLQIHLQAPIPSQDLQAGANTLRLSLEGGGTLHYDALRLVGDDAAPSDAVTAQVIPTILFPKPTSGALHEVVDLVFRHLAPIADSGLQFSLAAGPIRLPPSRAEFGDLAIRTEIEAPRAPAPYRLTLGNAAFAGTFTPAKQWKLYGVLRVHNDMGYTDLQENTRVVQENNTDQLVAALSAHPDHTFNLENSWLAQDYLEARNPAAGDRLLHFAENGQLGVSGFYLNLLTGLCSAEELHRALYFSAQLRREHGMPLTTASLADTPSQSWSVVSVLADAGIGAFSLASNQHRGPLLINGDLNERSPFWWEGPDGQRVLAFFTRGYGQMRRITNGSPALMARAIGQYVTRWDRPDFAPDALLVYGLVGDNAPIHDAGYAEIQKWNAAYAYPQIIAATDHQYYDYIREHFGSRLPVIRGDGGSYWADAAGTTTAATIENRAAQRDLPVAELAASWNTLRHPTAAYPSRDFDAAWREVLFYDEHSWGAHNSITQPGKEFVKRQADFKEAHAALAATSAQNLLTVSLKRLFFGLKSADPVVVVFNPGLQPCTQPVEAEIDDDRTIVDTRTGHPVALDILSEHRPPDIGNAAFFWYRSTLKPWRRVRFLATDVPGLGYASFAVQAADDPGSGGAGVAPNSWTLESKSYRVTLDPQSGAIASIFDKDLQRELIDPHASVRGNEVLDVMGGEGQSVVNNLHLWAASVLDIAGPHSARILEHVRTSWGERIRISAQARNFPEIETEIRVYDAIKRIDITDHVRKDDVLRKEGTYVAFPFAVSPPTLRYQSANGWVRAERDLLPGAPRDYVTTQNLVVGEDDQVRVALATPDLPLVTLTDINRGTWARHQAVANGHIYSYVTNNYWDTNIRPSQGGPLTLHYSITSMARSASEDALARFGTQTRQPCVVFTLPRSASEADAAGAPALAPFGQFFRCDAPDAQLCAFKVAEDGHGCILRVLETGGREGVAHVSSPVFPIRSVALTNGIEVDSGPLALTSGGFDLPLRPWRFTSVRVNF